MESELPSFKKPPLVETAISLQFQLIEGLKNAHLAIFWQSLKKKFPKVFDAEPIPEQVEVFGEQALRIRRFPSFRIGGGGAASRLQMASLDDQAMVQVQNGRIVFNWRQAKDGEYPRWRNVFPRFKAAMASFNKMLSSQGLGQTSPVQWEVVYVNHLPKGRDWNSPSDWSSLFPGIIGSISKNSVGTLESLGYSTHIALPEAKGRVHVDLYNSFSGVEAAAPEILVFQITARGGMVEPKLAFAYDGLELGHVAIVRTFCDLTSPEAQIRWEREVPKS
ncbi:MAG: TIGR04255 family protein [Phycisphaerae bacterium]